MTNIFTEENHQVTTCTWLCNHNHSEYFLNYRCNPALNKIHTFLILLCLIGSRSELIRLKKLHAWWCKIGTRLHQSIYTSGNQHRKWHKSVCIEKIHWYVYLCTKTHWQDVISVQHTSVYTVCVLPDVLVSLSSSPCWVLHLCPHNKFCQKAEQSDHNGPCRHQNSTAKDIFRMKPVFKFWLWEAPGIAVLLSEAAVLEES